MTTSTTVTYVAIGDSLSEGVGDVPWPDGTARGWTDRLAGLLADHHASCDYANLAVRGYQAAQVRDRQLAAAVALAPDVVTITAGMNDILRPRVDFDALAATLTDLVLPFRAMGARVLFVPIPDITSISPAGRLTLPRRLRLNAIYQRLCDESGVVPLTSTTDTVFEDPRAWAEDRLHLSPLGHERLATGAAEALGLEVEPGWQSPPPGPPPQRTLRTEAAWWSQHATPWIGRRLRGRSSGDGRSAKRPVLTRVAPDADSLGLDHGRPGGTDERTVR
ncbi:SGNH/GDSL hydrolase family protein [Nocardioides lijunqiniae]|uniref:SGNH/GDSL hydrolase family protein n=1 Tax=Nocardioides lijunqiniae TaxID=2760832 RepID=UPI001877AF21|nr:SGNH/GDSL hydrolase family protein [Nocardioides lijunqiniae]